MTVEKPDLNELLQYWQPVMGLADWRITALYVRHLERCWCAPKIGYRSALISMVDPIDWPTGAFPPYDIEEQLVHELGHCHMAPFKTTSGTPLGDAEEQVVTAYARGLVRLRRSGAAGI